MMSMFKRESSRPSVMTWIATAAVAVLMLAGCATKSPEEKVEANRGRYTAELNGFFVRQEPVAPAMDEEMPVEGEMVADAVAETTAAGEEGAEMAPQEVEPVDLKQDVTLDILIRHESFEKLPGITIDIAMQDAAGQEKGHWTMWADTADLEKGTHLQLTHVLEDLPYEEGDGFFVEVRTPIPADERGDYPEFSVGE